MRLSIIGAGLGDEKFLTLEARRCIQEADRVLATERLFASLAHLTPRMICVPFSHMVNALVDIGKNENCGNVALLVSGDCGFHSFGPKLPALLEKCLTGDIRFINGISSLQYLCARLGDAHDDATVLNLHGRNRDIVPFVSYRPKVFALTGGEILAHDILRQLVKADLADVSVTVGACLGSPVEQVATGTAGTLAEQMFPDPACLLIRNKNAQNPHQNIPDSAFLRGKAPMTKHAVRTQILAALDIQPKDIVFDIGAGTGSVSICMARLAFEGTVYAVEQDHEHFPVLAQNRLALGAFNLNLIQAEAPEGLQALPIPSKAFIGGSNGKIRDIMQALFARNPELRMVVSAITLETLHQAIEGFQAHGLDPEITCINAAVARHSGSYRLMQAENPVYIVAAGR